MQQSVDDEAEEAHKAARNTMNVLRAELNQVVAPLAVPSSDRATGRRSSVWIHWPGAPE